MGGITRVAVNGYGVIGKRVADAVVRQEDMVLAGVSDVVADWRVRTVTTHGFRLFGATGDHADRMRAVGLDVAGTSDELLNQADVVVDCTPKHVAAKNIDGYRRRGVKFIVQGGEKHETTGHSFVAESNTSARSTVSRPVWCPAIPRQLCGRYRRSSAWACFSGPGVRCSAARPIPGKATTAES